MRPAEGTTFEELALVVRWRRTCTPRPLTQTARSTCVHVHYVELDQTRVECRDALDTQDTRPLNFARPALNVATLWTHKTLAH